MMYLQIIKENGSISSLDIDYLSPGQVKTFAEEISKSPGVACVSIIDTLSEEYCNDRQE